MKQIPLTDGKTYTTVNDSIFGFLSQFKWYLDKGNYVYTHINSKKIRLHRMLMLAEPGQEIDHIDGNPLNNLTNNLRLCTRAENQRNRALHKNNTSGFKGVVRHFNKWRAQVRVNGKLRYFGIFSDKTQAARAYNEAVRKLFGNFARENDI